MPVVAVVGAMPPCRLLLLLLTEVVLMVGGAAGRCGGVGRSFRLCSGLRSFKRAVSRSEGAKRFSRLFALVSTELLLLLLLLLLDDESVLYGGGGRGREATGEVLGGVLSALRVSELPSTSSVGGST